MKSGIFLLQGRARVKIFGAGQARGQGRRKGRSQDLRGGAMVKLWGRAFFGQVLPMFWGGAALFLEGQGVAVLKILQGGPGLGNLDSFGLGRGVHPLTPYLT